MLQSCSRWPSRLLALGTLGVGLAIAPLLWQPADSQETPSQALTILADVQQANAVTGVITARGNVQLRYPARQIQATAAQAQYFSRGALSSVGMCMFCNRGTVSALTPSHILLRKQNLSLCPPPAAKSNLF